MVIELYKNTIKNRMLTRFAVKNYRGFKEQLVWDLSNPKNYSFNNEAIKDGVVKNGIIYGDNGSGKSNIGLAIFDIANHLSHKWKKPDYYLNFACAETPQLPVEFEYDLLLDGEKVTYCYSKRAKDIKVEMEEEHLFVNGRMLINKKGTTLEVAEEFGLSETAISYLKESENNISIVNYLLMSMPLPKGHILPKLRNFVENMLFFRSLDYREFIGLKEMGNNIEEYIINNNLTEDFANYLETVSAQKFNFVHPNAGDKILYCQIGEVKIPFTWVASTGTKNLELQYYWLKEMGNASFVFIDEFDAFYHFELSYSIAKTLFKNSHQVFLTTHDSYLLTNDLLRPDCYFIISENKIKPLCDLTDKELRYGHNLEKLYRGGTFGK